MTKVEEQIIKDLTNHLKKNPNVTKDDAVDVLGYLLAKNKEGAKVSLKGLDDYLEFDKSIK